MGDKGSKTKEERLFEMYVKAIISETQFYETLKRIRKEK